MKKLHLFISSSILATALFYNQDIGLNLLIINLVLIISSILHIKQLNRKIILISIGCIISSCSYVYYGDSISLFTNILYLCIFSLLAHHKRKDIVLFVFQSIVNIVTSPFRIIKKLIGKIKTIKGLSNLDYLNKIIYYFVLPLIISAIFTGIYANINPVLGTYLSNIDIEIPSFNIIFSLTLYTLLMYSFWYRNKKQLTSTLMANSEQPKAANIYIQNSATITFSILNLLILLLLVNDFKYLILHNTLPDNISISNYLHKGVNLAIVSTLMAITLIMLFLKGKNKDVKTKPLLLLSSAWLIMNIVLAISICFKNNIYINSFGLTEKRIGVYIYSLMSISGLLITLWKVYFKKSNYILIKNMYWILLLPLLMVCTINWSSVITKYNIDIHKTENIKLDVNYISDLNKYNLNQLLDLYDSNILDIKDQKKLSEKICNTINTKETSLLSFIYSDMHNNNILSNTKIKLKHFNDMYGKKLPETGITCLSKLTHIKINSYKDNIEINNFLSDKRHLENLNLSYTKIKSIPVLAEYGKLKSLNIKQCNINNIDAIEKLTGLEHLYIDQVKEHDYHLFKALTNLKTINTKNKLSPKFLQMYPYINN